MYYYKVKLTRHQRVVKVGDFRQVGVRVEHYDNDPPDKLDHPYRVLNINKVYRKRADINCEGSLDIVSLILKVKFKKKLTYMNSHSKDMIIKIKLSLLIELLVSADYNCENPKITS